MHLHHFAVVCGSVDNADRFYEGVLGLEKTKTTMIQKELTKKIFNIDCECRLLLYSNPHFAAEVFIISDTMKREPSFKHVCLKVHDRKDFIEKCRSEGCSINIIPRGDSPLTFIKDFDGNLFEIKEIDLK